MRQSKHSPKGFTLVQVLIATVFLLSLAMILATTAVFNLNYASYVEKSYDASSIAEAGINYYLWHLAHNINDYCDGQACPTLGPDGYGPFTHSYSDSSGKVVGSYDLYILPPPANSSMTTVKSIGRINGLNKSRVLQAQLAMPSFAQYALLTGTEIWIGQNENINGPLHSNVGVHFDGTTDGPVTASNATYRPTAQFGGDGAIHNGVWGNGGPQSFWQFPVPQVDFNAVTADLQKIKTDAQADGVYLPPTNPGNPASKLGYYLELRSNKSIDVYRVTRERCTSLNRTFVGNYPRPSNGLVYVEDNVWIQSKAGEKYSDRLTIAASYLPSTPARDKTITITGDILYSAKDGSSAVGLIAQSDVKINNLAPSTLEVNAALLAQKGHSYYNSSTLTSGCSNQVKTKITVYGAISSYLFWTWTYVNGSGNTIDGYNTTVSTYDNYLKLNPPPSFPTTGSFSVLNFRELLENP